MKLGRQSKKNYLKNGYTSRELAHTKILLSQVYNTLNAKIVELEKSKQELETKLAFKEQLHKIEKSRLAVKIKLSNKSQILKEMKKEKVMIAQKADSEKSRNFTMMRKYYLTIAIAGLVLGAYVGGDSFYENGQEEQYVIVPGKTLKTKYVVQNVKDTIEIASMRDLPTGTAGDNSGSKFAIGGILKVLAIAPLLETSTENTLHVNILNSNIILQERIDVIRDAILSDESIDIDNSRLLGGSDSTYYMGWGGALKSAAQHSTQFPIPTNIEIIEAERGEGEIIIELTTQKDTIGYLGFTRSTVDDNRILKSHITIYEADIISDEQLAALIRHELGHALGLPHFSSPQDLMYDVIETDYPFISACDIDAIVALYDGKELGELACRK